VGMKKSAVPATQRPIHIYSAKGNT